MFPTFLSPVLELAALLVNDDHHHHHPLSFLTFHPGDLTKLSFTDRKSVV